MDKVESKKVEEKSAEEKVVSEIEDDILEPEKTQAPEPAKAKKVKTPSVSDVVAKTLAKVKGIEKPKNNV